MAAQNDWIVAGINNPSFSTGDLVALTGMSTDNTQFLSKDEYLKSDFIKNNDLFKDENNNFSKDIFDQYYDMRAAQWADFANQTYYSGPALSAFNIMRPREAPILSPEISIGRHSNPHRQKVGIEDIGVWSKPEFSDRELAKQNKIFNTKTGEFEKFSVNDHTLVTSPIKWLADRFRDPLVMAAYDEDGTHIDPISGLEVEHKKGDLKLNDKGTFYYETLGDRSVIGKDVLSTFDTFTVDGKGLNKYDFFDSNDINKSIGGTIMKNVAAIVPLFCGPVVGSIYAGMQIAREMSRLAPTAYGILTGWNDSKTPTWINRLAAYGESAASSTSDYAKQHTFAGENFINTISDVAMQWGQQQLIAKAFGQLRGSKKIMEEATRNAQKRFAMYAGDPRFIGKENELWEVCKNMYIPQAQKLAQEAGALGRNLSIAYMAATQSRDVYEDAINAGTTKGEAALMGLGSTLGMYWIDRYLHLGEIFFDEATPDVVKQSRNALRKEFKDAAKVFQNIKADPTLSIQNKVFRTIAHSAKTTKDAIVKFFNNYRQDLKYHTLGLTGKMLGEGLEEVGEEFMADMSKQLYTWASELGLTKTKKDVGAWENFWERYSMNFFGGAIGGGIFYGKQAWDARYTGRNNYDADLAYLIRNGHADELRNQLADMHKNGDTGNKKLDATIPDVTEDGNPIWRSAKPGRINQAQFIHDRILDKINSFEEVLLADRNASLSDDELFENMVLSESRYNRLKNYQQLKEIAPLTNIFDDYNNDVAAYATAESNLRHAYNTVDGTANGTLVENDVIAKLKDDMRAVRQANIDKLIVARDAAKAKIDSYFTGENCLDFVRRLNFLLDPNLHEPFLPITREAYFNEKFPGQTLESLTPDQQARFLYVDWPNYVKDTLKSNAKQAYKDYKDFAEKVNPHLENYIQNLQSNKDQLESLSKLVNGLRSINGNYINWNTKLTNESDEDYEKRNEKKDNETDEDFEDRKLRRELMIEAINQQIDKVYADNIKQLLGNSISHLDPFYAGNIKQILSNDIFSRNDSQTISDRGRIRSIINRAVNLFAKDRIVNSELKNLNTDLSNVNDVKDNIYNAKLKELQTKIINAFSNLANIQLTYANGAREKFSESADLGMSNLELILSNIDGYGLTDESKQEVANAIQLIKNFGINDLMGLYPDNCDGIENILTRQLADVVDKVVQNELKSIFPLVDDIVKNISNNPLYNLQKDLKVGTVNPIGELLKNVAAANNDKLPDNFDQLLETINSKFENVNNFNELILDDTQRDALLKTKDYLKLLQVYVYAASTVPNTQQIIGHNKTINSFAESHKDKLLAPWAKLPELDNDLALISLRVINDYIHTIDDWTMLSDRNSGDKIRKIIEIDSVFARTMWDVLSGISRDFHCDIDDKNYDLLEGLNAIDTSKLGTIEAQVPLYELERLVHKNIKAIADANNITVAELVQQTDILEHLVPNISEIKYQKNLFIHSHMTADDVSPWMRLQYFAMIMSEDPAIFFDQLNKTVAADNGLVPTISQEFSSRLAQSALNKDFRDILEIAYGKTKMDMPYTPNVIFISGVAGAGKSVAISKGVASRFNPDDKIWISAPKTTQASNLASILGRTDYKLNDDLMNQIVENYNDIKSEVAKVTDGSGNFDYIKLGRLNNGELKVELNENNVKLKSIEDTEIPKAIFIDEASNLSLVDILILNKFAQEHNIPVYLLGGVEQIGYLVPGSQMGNVDELFVAMCRTPNLTLSLRDANLQKYNNQNDVISIISQLREKFLYDNEQAYKAYFPDISNMYKKLNFRVYTKDDIKGDLIINDLDNATIDKLKGKQVAFIGDQNSPYLNKLRTSGVDIPANMVMQLSEVQGQEFDYIITDHKFEAPTNMSEAKTFLSELYTLMSRAKNGAIFISDTLGNIIGENRFVDYNIEIKPISEAAAQMKNLKKSMLGQMNLKPFVEAKSGDEATDEKTAPATTTISTADGSDSSINGADGSGTVVNNPTPQTNPKNPPKPNQSGGNGAVSTSTGDSGADTSTNSNISQNIKDQTTIDNADNTVPPSGTPVSPNPDVGVTPEARAENKKSKQKRKDSEIKGNLVNEIAKDEQLANEDNNATTKITNDSDINTYPVQVYGDGIILSVVNGENPQGSKYPSWVIEPPKQGEPRRNLQALYDDGSKFDYVDNKRTAQKNLEKVISVIKYGHAYEKLDGVVKQRFSKDNWDNGKFEVEFRFDTPNSVRALGTGMDHIGSTNFAKNGLNAICSLTFTVRDRNNNICKFDLGQFTDPYVFATNKESIVENVMNSNPAANRDLIRRKVDAFSAAYTNWFSSKVKELDNKPSVTQEIDSNDIDFTNCTWFVSRTGPNIVLGDNDVKTTRKNEAVRTFRASYPTLVVSPVYVYGQNKNDVDQLFGSTSDALRGRAMVFMTDDTTLRPDQLCEIYIKQKRDPKNNKPRVRAVVLNNYGLTYRELCNRKFVEDHTPENGHLIRQDFTGMRMFVSMWNARAALINFNKALDKWKADKFAKVNGNVDEAIDALLKRQYDIYQYQKRGMTSPYPPDANLAKYNLTDNDVALIDEFNKTYCRDIPMFRLGFSMAANADHTPNNGFHIQRTDVSNNRYYNGSQDTDTELHGKDGVQEANLCFLTPYMASKFLTIADSVMTPICGSFDKVEPNSIMTNLNCRITNPDTNKDFQPHEYINFTNAKHLNSLSGMLSQDKGSKQVVIMNENGVNIEYEKKAMWSVIPMYLNRYGRFLDSERMYAQNENGIIHYMTFKDKANDSENTLVIDYSSLRGNLQTEAEENQRIFYDFTNLVFHGTIDDIHKKYGAEPANQLMQMDDAYFKQGFFINPCITRTKQGQNLEVKGVNDENGTLDFYEVGTPGDMFLVDISPRRSGANVYFGSLLGIEFTRPEPGPTHTQAPQGSPVIIDSSEDTNAVQNLDEESIKDQNVEEEPEAPIIEEEQETPIDTEEELTIADKVFLSDTEDIVYNFSDKNEENLDVYNRNILKSMYSNLKALRSGKLDSKQDFIDFLNNEDVLDFFIDNLVISIEEYNRIKKILEC